MTTREGQRYEPSAETLIVAGSLVRRLTPVECCRLQGFPDDWNAFGAGDKPISDAQRYRQMGNAVTVNVAEWIGRRIAMVVARHAADDSS